MKNLPRELAYAVGQALVLTAAYALLAWVMSTHQPIPTLQYQQHPNHARRNHP